MNFYKQIVLNWKQFNSLDCTALKYYLNHSEDPRHWQVLSRAKDDLYFCEAIEKALRENVAVVDEKDYIDYTVCFIINVVQSCSNSGLDI